MSRKCNKCGYYDGNSCEAGVTPNLDGCDYHYETLKRKMREKEPLPLRGENKWYTKNGNYLVFYCSECDAANIRKTRYCPECGVRKEDVL